MRDQIDMRTTVRILSYYTIAIMLFIIVIPLLTTVATEKVPLSTYMQGLSFIPVIALVIIMLLGTRWIFKRTAVIVLAVYTAVVFLYYIVLWFTPPLDPFEIILASLYVPILVFAGLVLIGQTRKTI
jgi:hypothetical protein